ncbi:response regulator [Sulfurimonas sp. MAG313]|nr:response regulator [Sulfurimonas sp. MAG313]MDF1881204.1 response regulator [Sulfurimonas sp. MAG313]
MSQKILIVDDQVENLHLLVDIFSDEGHEMLVAKNGDEALSVAREELPDLMLLDINMPTLNGYEVCELLQESAKTKDISIIFLSAQSSSVDEAHGLKLGAVDFISKPFVVEIVKQRVRIHLELKEVKNRLKECIQKQNS